MGTPIKQHSFISFQPLGDNFRSLVSLEDAFKKDIVWQDISDRAANIYLKKISLMKAEIESIKETKKIKHAINARQMWTLGNYIFELIDDLEKLQLQIDGVYDHLERDLSVKRKWLEKVVILRRYVTTLEIIPKDLKWSLFEHSIKNKVEQLIRGELNNE